MQVLVCADAICLPLSVTYVVVQIRNFLLFSDYYTRNISSYLLSIFMLWPQLTRPKKLRSKVRVVCIWA